MGHKFRAASDGDLGAVNDFSCVLEEYGKFGENSTAKDCRIRCRLRHCTAGFPDNTLHLAKVPLEYKIPWRETGKQSFRSRLFSSACNCPASVDTHDFPGDWKGCVAQQKIRDARDLV